jgi:hypothetical protein
MKKILSVIMLAAFGLMVACTGQIEKEVKITKNDSVIEKDIVVKMGCKHGMADSCNMEKCCSSKVCDSLCQELSKIICQIVDIRVKQAMCMQMCQKDKDMKCDPAKCDPKKCDPSKCPKAGK